jgi:small GTP-binding protein
MYKYELLQIIKQAVKERVTKLNLNGRQLLHLPREIRQLKQLQQLSLSGNLLKSLPPEIGQLTQLQYLNLSNNGLNSLPPEIGQLSQLEELDLSNNSLDSLPPEIGQLSQLEELDLSNNSLDSLPPEIGQLSQLEELDLSNNSLDSLPPEIGQLSQLKELDLSDNILNSLTPEIGHLTQLQHLDLRKNYLSSLPPEIGRLSQLRRLVLYNASYDDLYSIPDDFTLENPPPEVVEKGLQAILQFLQQLLKEGIDRLCEAKLLIVGEGGAGKTTLTKKIDHEQYQLVTDQQSTEGIDIIRWQFSYKKDQNFAVNVWDFGGQEIYHATHQFFLTKRSLYILVADSRKEDTDFFYWLNVVNLLSESSPIIIVKNEKQDRQREINERQLRGEFLNLQEVLATNLATNRGLAKIKLAIKQHITRLPHIGAELPKS